MTIGSNELIDAPPGLRDVVAAETELGDVRGWEGFYHYRQYSAIELAAGRSFEEVWLLLLTGRLPDADELERFTADVVARRALPERVRSALSVIATTGARFDPLAGLRTALSLVAGAEDLRPLWDTGADQRRADAVLVCAVTPTILAALYRLRQGHEPIAPRPDLSTAANWLYMISGHEAKPEVVRAVERYLIATIDHGFNASTFTARVVASTGADMVAAVAAAIGAFSGPLHGGAPDRALDGLDEIGASGDVESWVRDKVARGDRIMGFGHAVYRTDDPRSVMLKGIAAELGGELAEFAISVEQRVVEALAELKPGRRLYANVEYYAGVVMESCGIPRAMFTPTFAVSRVVGWTANVLEQAGSGKIIRPAARYVGPAAPQPVPVRH